MARIVFPVPALPLMKILFDFEDRANKYWGVPLAAIDDLKSMLTLEDYKIELQITKQLSHVQTKKHYY